MPNNNSNDNDNESDGLAEDDSGGSDSDDDIVAKVSKKRKLDDTADNDGDDDDDDDDDDDGTKEKTKKKKKKGSSKPSWIDDAAEESGDEADSDDEEDEDDDAPNDYIKDGFVVDEADDERKKSDDGLEDSDDDNDDDDDDDGRRKKKGISRIRRMNEQLDDDDLALINEAKGVVSHAEQERLDRIAADAAEAKRKAIVARDGAELRAGLFDGGEDDEDFEVAARGKLLEEKIRAQVERYDEDGMDDFIDDDIGDQEDILNSDRRGAGGGGQGEVSEAQLQEASDIFGTDYLEFMANEGKATGGGGDDDDEDEEAELMGRRGSSYREKGVGIDYGVDFDEEMSDDDDDLFGDADDDDDMADISESQRAEALKLKRQKREIAKQERRQAAYKQKMEKRKAQLRKAFEPVQLIENFCTDRDDEIRELDAPERFFDLVQQQKVDKTSVDRFPPGQNDPITPGEQEEAEWILRRISPITQEFRTPPPVLEGRDPAKEFEEHQRAIVESIVYALRYMLRDHLEPAFVEHYRADRVSKESVSKNLHLVLDDDAEYQRMNIAKSKVEIILETVTRDTDQDEAAGSEEETILKLQKTLDERKEQLDVNAKKETSIQAELEQIKQQNLASTKIDDDDDDNLFGNDDEDDEENEKKKEEEAEVR